MRPAKFIIADCIFLMLFISCTKEVDTPVEINGINTTVRFIISPLSQEISGFFQSEREVCIYGSHSNYTLKSSPVYIGITKGESNNSIIYLNNVESHALYLRVNIWHRYYENNNRVFYRSFYYVDSIPIPDYKCNVEVRIEKGRWIQE